ncbi:MAG: transposase [Deltaproteobacteria bacterium]|nr:transposase [Deltaproteobacteria bacterium]
MARLARVVVPKVPHHITQRGNRSQESFFNDDDYRAYISLMAASCRQHGVEVWAYCLMCNHVHMLAVPDDPDNLRSAIGEAHRRYTRAINARNNWRGHLWQERFSSFPLDEPYLLAAAHHVELNPVRVGVTDDPVSYPWSSAKSHVLGQDDELVKVKPLLDMVPDWKTFLLVGFDEKDKEYQLIRKHQKTGRPLGDSEFVRKVEQTCNRVLSKQKPGPKRKDGRK